MVKGVSLTLEAQKMASFEAIKEMVLDPGVPKYIVANQIRRTKEHGLTTQETIKKYEPCSLKRKFSSDQYRLLTKSTSIIE